MASDIVTRELKKPINLVEYLYRRLHEVGIRSVHGVPGSYASYVFFSFLFLFFCLDCKNDG